MCVMMQSCYYVTHVFCLSALELYTINPKPQALDPSLACPLNSLNPKLYIKNPAETPEKTK
jgi:hypothetical protein